MPTCASCGADNREGARFCDACGAVLEDAPPSREQRKVVTVLFCDVTGSTELGERLDPESLRALLARYFDRMKAIVERHGGTVEKFIGDAVMAVFGVPVVHEDDALRALRAAAEMRDAFSDLGVEGRIGIMTGEVVTGTEERLATGDAVNVAARLEQSAAPGEILLGENTLALARDAVEVEGVPALALKGKSEPLRAYRLVAVRALESIARRLDTPMVGRETELRRLHDAFDQAAHDRSCQLFTVLGAAGVGKSRLAAEFLTGAGDANIVRGRCLPYGEGITYWPVVEVIKQLDAVELSGPAGDAIRSLLGEGETAATATEIAWAFRKLLEAAAEERVLVCVLDDLHWGEATYLDLVEHVADLSRDAPILLLCMARPDLLDRRPAWGGGKLNATTVLLEPLGQDETERLIESLGELDEPLRTRIRAAAEGNPLFVEQMVALVQDSGDGEIVVPPTIQALLAARLDQLDSSERGVLEAGSVEGRLFHRGAVQALAPEESEVPARLTTLVRKELVRPDKPQLIGEDAFRFRHLLIRDAAYDGLPKSTRADLHERFAEWLEVHGGDLVELDEILGFHLEQASGYRRELGMADEAVGGLARRAAERLLAGGRTAHGRGDVPAAVELLRRSAELVADEPELWLGVALELIAALYDGGRFEEARAEVRNALAAAMELSDERVLARAWLLQISIDAQAASDFELEQAIIDVQGFADVLSRFDDDEGLARAVALKALLTFFAGRVYESERLAETAAAHARRAGNRQLEAHCLLLGLGAKTHGPAPAAEGIDYANHVLGRAGSDPLMRTFALQKRAHNEAMSGEFAAARASAVASKEIAAEFGLRLRLGAQAMDRGEVELLAGDPQAAERELREGYELLGELGESGFRSTVGSILAVAIAEQGRLDEAARLADDVAAMAQADDRDPKSRLASVRARLFVARGALDDAERHAREAIEAVEATDYIPLQADARMALANVHRAAGRLDEAKTVAEEALRLYEQKGNVVMAGRTRAWLSEPIPSS